MTHQELIVAYRNQRAMLKAIAKSLNLHLDLPGPPSAALAFAETLLLCPSQHGATEQMRQDRAGARAFLANAKSLEPLLLEAGISTAGQNLKDSTPFFVLGSAVQEYLRHLKVRNEESWK
jgi:hypothetical protein